MRDFAKNTRNAQVRWLAGEEDLEGAKETLTKRLRIVGLTERFNEFLLLFRERVGLTGFDVRYAQRVNRRSASPYRDEVLANFDRYRDEVLANNELDIKLYEFAANEVWPRQVAEYGEDRLRQDVAREFRRPVGDIPGQGRLIQNFLFRNLLYKLLVRADRKRLGRTRRPRNL